MVKLIISFISIILLSPLIYATTNISIEGDVRYLNNNSTKDDLKVHLAAIQLRKIFSDDQGDRWSFSTMLESENDFEENHLHELFLRYKGPLGSWNLTGGRFTIPYGLLNTFSSSRLLYDTVYEETVGFESDNGGMLSGFFGNYDYALSLTQGYGSHHSISSKSHGLISGRIGRPLGDTEELSLGLSLLAGETALHHDKEKTIKRYLLGIDTTLYAGPFLIRSELNTGKKESEDFFSAFGAINYILNPKLDLTVSGTYINTKKENDHSLFVGLTMKPKWCTFRVGYQYENNGEKNETLLLQVYRIFTTNY